VGLVNCFYRLANPTTPAMRWEAVAVNGDFWSQVLQSNTLKRQDFALGAVMLMRREAVEKIGGFESLLHYLADDYQLGQGIAKSGLRIELSPVVVECWDKPMNFRAVWNHQLRWARTIRVSQPVPFFFSILSNATLWAAGLALFGNLGGFPLVPDSLLYNGTLSPRLQNALSPLHVPWVLVIFAVVLGTRILIVTSLQQRFTRERGDRRDGWFILVKDFLGVAIWAAAFLGNTILWRGRKMRLTRGGTLVPSQRENRTAVHDMH
jgi:ceramide glucosyltransferase